MQSTTFARSTQLKGFIDDHLGVLGKRQASTKMGQTLRRASLVTPEVAQFANRKFVLSIGVNQMNQGPMRNGIEVPPIDIRVAYYLLIFYTAPFCSVVSTADSSLWTRFISQYSSQGSGDT